MIDALSAAENAMLNDVLRMHVVSQNLANVSTAGYKKESVLSVPFADYLALSGAGMTAGEQQVLVPRPVDAATMDHTQGTLRYTGNPLDVALEGDGLFSLLGQSGPLYTRAGNFHVDAQGRLVSAGGLPVLGTRGEIHLTTSDPKIDAQGNVREHDQVIDQLQVVGYPQDGRLINLGSGLYAADRGGPEPAPLATASLRQGHVETANVVVTDEMLKIIETVRHFESSQRVLQSVDAMLDKSINTLGEL